MDSVYEPTVTYQLIVTRRSASEILAIPSAAGWNLPRVEIQQHCRIAEQLTANAKGSWGIGAYCLSIMAFPTDGPEGKSCFALMELVHETETVPSGTCWVPRMEMECRSGSIEAGLIRKSFELLDANAIGRTAGPFSKPGWLVELRNWVQERVAPFGLRLSRELRQLNASPSFSLIRFETDRQAIWFKATGAPNSHEPRLTVALARLFPGCIPRVLAVHGAWNGWLSEEAQGMSLGESTNLLTWQRAAKELAHLQAASIGKTKELLDAQAKDLRTPRLAGLVEPFIDRMKELMAVQRKKSPAPLLAPELSMLAESLHESCEFLDSFRISDSLGHLDLNPANILMSSDRCVFLDWAEACVTNPLLTFEYLREYMRRSGIECTAANKYLADAYLGPWTSFYSLDTLKHSLKLAPLLAVFAYAVANDSWRSVGKRENPLLEAHFRSLTRRMYREAMQVAERSATCLN